MTAGQKAFKAKRIKDIDKLPQKNIKPIFQNESFNSFWKAYPKKKAKGDAEKAFIKLNPNKELFQKIIKAIDFFKHSNEWLADDGKYIPYPATWLRSRRWEDEEVVAAVKEDAEDFITSHTRQVPCFVDRSKKQKQ